MDQTAKKKFIVIDVVTPNTQKQEAEKNLSELISLVDTYGGAIIVRIIQRRDFPDSATYIGKGKAAELVDIVKQEKIDIVVINAIVNQSQLFTLTQMLWQSNPNIQVWDRIDLILNIFNKHARTAEAKLQIELARMGHMGPRMYGLGGTVLSRQAGGIGTRGLGETNVELMKRHWRDQMKQVNDKLKKLNKNREQQLSRRREVGLKTVSIIGYTNAGKTTLFNRLTRKNKLTENVLFATLDSHVGRLHIGKWQEDILISDTIGFIKNLPPALIDAFKSTLMESIHADLLLHLIDISDPKMEEKIMIVEQILQELGIGEKDKLYVFNKVDIASPINKDEFMRRYAEYHPHFISVKNEEGIPELIDSIKKHFI